LFSYKVRQFVDGSPVPVEIIQVATPTFTFGSNQGGSGAPSTHMLSMGVIGSARVSSPLQMLQRRYRSARAPGHFYAYQVQTINGAGTASAWSSLSSNINTGLPGTIITQVSNYPNPVDTRKGVRKARRSSTTFWRVTPMWRSRCMTCWVIV